MLERSCQAVGLVPGVTEHVGEEPLDDAVPADGGHRRPVAFRRQLHALVELVVEQASLGKPLDRRRHRPGRYLERLRKRTGVRVVAVVGQPVDGLQGLAFGLRERRVHGFGRG